MSHKSLFGSTLSVTVIAKGNRIGVLGSNPTSLFALGTGALVKGVNPSLLLVAVISKVVI